MNENNVENEVMETTTGELMERGIWQRFKNSGYCWVSYCCRRFSRQICS